MSQWNAIGLIAASRAFGIAIPPIVTDTNQVWVAWDENVTTPLCTGTQPSSCVAGQFGYNAWDDPLWGPWAVTPSGMVQMAMDGVGRTASGVPDQRWNMAESNYHDNFCDTGGDSTTNPKMYTYGMFSFSKSMEQHDPGGVLTPITYLLDMPSGTNPIDWYGAQSGVNGAPCDGFAQTLVGDGTSLSATPRLWAGRTPWAPGSVWTTSRTKCFSRPPGPFRCSRRHRSPLASLT